MAVGAYACYKLMTGFPEMNLIICILLSGGITAMVGILFGLPSLRIKGFYLAVATLAAQFFLVWLFNKVGWFYNYSASGQINAPEQKDILGIIISGPNSSPEAVYLVCLSFLTVLALVARNDRGSFGRKWTIRDMDIIAEIIGVNPLMAKLTAFGVSSFMYVGIAGALLFSVYLGAVEVGEVFGIQKSFLVLFMIIIGGLGSIFGSLAGAAFLVLMPVVLKNVMVGSLGWPVDIAAHFEFLIVGSLIVFFLIVEPHGFAMLWRTYRGVSGAVAISTLMACGSWRAVPYLTAGQRYTGIKKELEFKRRKT